MITKIQYVTATDRSNVLTANSSKFLIEEQNITEGNFLIFTDIEPVENKVTGLQDNFDIMYAQMLKLQGVAVNV